MSDTTDHYAEATYFATNAFRRASTPATPEVVQALAALASVDVRRDTAAAIREQTKAIREQTAVFQQLLDEDQAAARDLAEKAGA